MEFSCALRSNLPATKLCSVNPNRKTQLKSNFQVTPVKWRGWYSRVKSVLNNHDWSSINDNGSTEPARILFERLFSQTHKLEQHLSRDNLYDVQLHFSFENLETDLHAALVALKKCEEDLQDAEKAVLLEHGELTRAKEELEPREKEIVGSCSQQEKIENEFREANLKLLTQTKQIEDLKYRLEEREGEITTAISALSLKEDELEKMRVELITKREEASRLHDEMEEKTRLLNVANEVVKNHEDEVSGLHGKILEKEEEIKHYVALKKQVEDKVKVAEASLEKMTRECINKGIIEEISGSSKTRGRRQQMEEQEQVLTEQVAELEEQKNIVMDYMGDLKDAKLEVENEKVKLKVAEARKTELESELSIKSEILENNDLSGFRPVSVQQWDNNPAPDYELQCEMLRSEIKIVESALAEKDEELKMVKEKIHAREKVIAVLKENDLTSLYDLAEQRIGKNTLGELVTESLLHESVCLDSETATTALQKLAELSGQVLSKARSSVDLDTECC